MYKTVRHGENSLQYKILAQQEEGVAAVKCRRTPRALTAKLITVAVLLIMGIIASAVLVPLVLTNDFIALTGTFQKFSVSTLRRSHSGNHVVVIAKKPYGWSGPHSSSAPKLLNASQTHSNIKKSTLGTEATSTTTETLRTTLVTKTTANAGLPSKPVTTPATKGTVKPRPTESAIPRSSHENEKKVRLSTTAEPVWFEPVKKWRFGSSGNFMSGVSGVMSNPTSILAMFCFVIVIIIMFFFLRKTLPKKRTEKEPADLKEDKTRLLKPSVSSDHDEE